MTEVEPRDDAPSGASAATRSVPKRSDTTSTMGESADRHLEDAKVWQIIVSFLWLAVGWAFVVSLFSQQFSIGDNVVSFLLRATTGNYTGFPVSHAHHLRLYAFSLLLPHGPLSDSDSLCLSLARAQLVFSAACVCTFLLLYVLDISYWRGTLGVILRRVCTIGFCILSHLCDAELQRLPVPPACGLDADAARDGVHAAVEHLSQCQAVPGARTPRVWTIAFVAVPPGDAAKHAPRPATPPAAAAPRPRLPLLSSPPLSPGFIQQAQPAPFPLV